MVSPGCAPEFVSWCFLRSMVIDNFRVVHFSVFPLETQPELIVHPNAVLPVAISD